MELLLVVLGQLGAVGLSLVVDCVVDLLYGMVQLLDFLVEDLLLKRLGSELERHRHHPEVVPLDLLGSQPLVPIERETLDDKLPRHGTHWSVEERNYALGLYFLQ